MILLILCGSIIFLSLIIIYMLYTIKRKISYTDIVEVNGNKIKKEYNELERIDTRISEISLKLNKVTD